jgi:putative hydrolases of HD superfamily
VPIARLDRQLRFIAEMDKLKGVERMISLIGGARRENSAEHSWHLAVMAPLLAEYAPAALDLARVVIMLLVHDIVEIDAGDTFAFDAAGAVDKDERERRAAARLFGLLPADQAGELRGYWDEFEARKTPEARFAVAMDRFQGLLMNRGNGGGTWKIHAITREQVLQRMAPIREGAPALWSVVLAVLDQVGLGAS